MLCIVVFRRQVFLLVSCVSGKRGLSLNVYELCSPLL